MVTIRSVAGMNEERALSVVVLPEPVPPLTRILSLALTQASRNVAIFSSRVPKLTKSFIESAVFENFLIVTAGPTKDNGGMIILTREPSARRASTNGEDSSTRRPSGVKIRSIMLIKWVSS